MSVIFWAGLTQVNSSCATAKVGPNRRTRPAVRRREMGARSTLNTNPGYSDIYGPQCDIWAGLTQVNSHARQGEQVQRTRSVRVPPS